MEEFLSQLFENEFLEVKSGNAESFFNPGIRNLVLSKEDGLLTYKELELLRAASSKCSVCNFGYNIYSLFFSSFICVRVSSNERKIYFTNQFVLFLKLLQTLQFSVCSTDEQVKIFVPYIARFKYLRVLDLKHTGIDDQCLGVLGANCKDLRYTDTLYSIYLTRKLIIHNEKSRNLDVSFCKVTDQGLQMLCIEENRSPGCCLIEQLSILKTNVTRKGFKQMVLRQKNLSALLWGDSLAALSELSAELETQRTFPLSQLGRVLVGSDECVLHILRASFICPNLSITNMKIQCDSSLSNACLSFVVSMPRVKLRELYLIGGNNLLITFFDGIVPVLKTIGENLIVLKISKFEFVEPFVVVVNCPNLKRLKLSSNCYTENATLNSFPVEGSLRHLEEFAFRGSDPFEATETNLSEHQLTCFLSSPRLKELNIQFCAMLTDKIFEEAFRRTKFEKLMYVNLSCCDSITQTGLDILKREENSILFLYVEFCFYHHENRLLQADWTSIAKEKNWDIQVCFVSQSADERAIEMDDVMQVDDV